MKPDVWRPALLTLCATVALVYFAVLVNIVGIGGAPRWPGMLGLSFRASSVPYNLEVQTIDPAGPSARAGIRQGDLVDIRANSLIERFWEVYGPMTGRPIVLSVHRGSQQENIAVDPPPLKASFMLQSLWGWVGSFWLLLFSALIAWRRADVPDMRILALILVLYSSLYVVASNLSVAGPTTWTVPWAWMYVVANIFGNIAFPLAIALSSTLAGSFALPLSRARRIAQRLCFALVGLSIAGSAPAIVGITTLRFDPVGFWYAPIWNIPIWGASLLALACSVLAIAASRGSERQRAAWTLAPLGLILFVIQDLGAFLSLLPLSYAGTTVLGNVLTMAFFVAPVALTYAALSRRLIDTGFVLNRALIFAIVSAIVIGVFVSVEWAVSTWLTGTTHTTSTIIGMVVALVLGLSLRFVHKYVDRIVDRVFFRKRHEDEAALRRFAHEASYITDRSKLLDRTAREVKQHTNAADVSILVPDGAQTYKTVAAINCARTVVDENDPALVSMRAWHKSVDLHGIDGSALCGEFAYPMVSRGALVGTLVCGAKPDGELYAPDESDALISLAHGVGTALDALSLSSVTSIESLREAQTQILEELRALRHKPE